MRSGCRGGARPRPASRSTSRPCSPPTITPGGTATAGSNHGDGVRFEAVSFAYPGSHEIALDGVELHIPPGSKLAIVGENGSGKTTLIKLLTRLYEPTSGRITLDGRD